MARFLQRSRRNLSLSSEHAGGTGQGPKRRGGAEGTVANHPPLEQVGQIVMIILIMSIYDDYYYIIIGHPPGVADPLDYWPRTTHPSLPWLSPPWTPPLAQWQSPRPTPGQLGARGYPPAQLWRLKLLLVRIAMSTADTASSTRVIGGSLLWVCTVRRRGGLRRGGGVK